MKTLALLLLLSPVFALAQNWSGTCDAVGDSSVDSGGGTVISQIQSLSFDVIKASSDVSKQDWQLTFRLKVQGVDGIDVTNGDTKEKIFTETYTAKEDKGDLMFELKASPQNIFHFTSVFIQFAPPNGPVSAGPVFPGTWDQKLSFAFVDSNLYYKNPTPMMVKKVSFNCKTTFTY